MKSNLDQDKAGHSSVVRIVIIDPNFSRTSPSLKSFLQAIPYLEAEGFSVNCWTANVDRDFASRVTLKFHLCGLPSPFKYWLFSLQATLAHLFWIVFSSKAERKSTLFVSIGSYSPLAPVAMIHFSQRDWMRALLTLPLSSPRDFYEIITRPLDVILEWLHQRSPFVRRFVIVSDGVTQEFRAAGVPSSKLFVLPNSFDPTRFCRATRELYRADARKTLQLAPSDIVFCFCSMGHFRRKGLHLAFQALQLVRQSGHPEVKLILIGGDKKKVEAARRMAQKYCVAPSDWIQILGHQDQPERFMSAADALILPSYSEALPLVEIEAAALGLRLYLTHHHGSEMILDEPVNGRYLDWNVEAMADTLIEETESNAVRLGSQTCGRAVSAKQFSERLAKLLSLP